MLAYLENIFGIELACSHAGLWEILSGEAEDDDIRNCLKMFYDTIPCFANFCDMHYYFGDKSKSYFTRMLDDIKAVLTDARAEVAKYGGKFLGESEGYVYYAFPEGTQPTNVKGQVLK